MFQAPKRLSQFVLAVAAICSLIILPACKPAAQPGADIEFRQAREQLARAAERLADEQRPITDRAALAQRLKLDPKRFDAIKTGAQVTGPIVLAFDSGANCKNGTCTCVGDRDCNDMFSTVCRNESTDGSCSGSGDTTVCTCIDVVTPTPVEPG